MDLANINWAWYYGLLSDLFNEESVEHLTLYAIC